MQKTVTLLKILGNENRLRILKYLYENGEAAVDEIATNTRCSFKAASNALQLLRHHGIVESHYEGLFNVYRLANKQDKILLYIIRQL